MSLQEVSGPATRLHRQKSPLYTGLPSLFPTALCFPWGKTRVTEQVFFLFSHAAEEVMLWKQSLQLGLQTASSESALGITQSWVAFLGLVYPGAPGNLTGSKHGDDGQSQVAGSKRSNAGESFLPRGADAPDSLSLLPLGALFIYSLRSCIGPHFGITHSVPGILRGLRIQR